MTTTTTCEGCGAPLQPNDSFCKSCGRPTGVPQTEKSTFDILQGAVSDRYRVERELGRGGMATVYLAHDLRHERDVAIKVLHPELAATMGPERFEREIKLSAKLQHPHILSLYDSGNADGLLYYVMPFVKGESLRERLDREQMLPLEDALSITIEVADALGYAHGLGIVHRDIKPENIMLSGGHALVADFGIARALTGAASEQKLTQTGSAIGTPLYMSPEQASGDEAGPRSDLYSLGCVAYEMLTGGPPFTGANARAIMARHTMEMVPSLRVVRDTVPEHVENAIYAVMSKVVADRPKDAASFIALLTGGDASHAARGRAATLSRMTAARVIPAEAKRGVPRWAIAAGIAAVVVVGGGVALTMKNRPAPAAGLDSSHLAVLYFDDNSADHSLGYLADGLTEGLIRTLSRGGINVVSSGGSALFKGTGASDDSIARGLGVGTLVKGSVEPVGSNVRVQFQLVDASGSDFERGAFVLPAGNVLAITDTLVDRVARSVRSAVGAEFRRREQRQQTRSADAWVFVQRAELLRKQADSLAADTVRFDELYTRADSLAALAEQADNRWLTPITLRATLAYWRSRRYFEPGPARPWIEISLGHVNRALAIDAEDPDALELRGTLQYWAYLIGLRLPGMPNDSVQRTRARADLEQATAIEPAQAGAYAMLSHLYSNDPTKRVIDVANAAGEALRRDAFLGNAALIQSRLFFAWYDYGDSARARESCSEGFRRFPGDARFTECRLLVMTMTRQAAPAAAAAWRLADSTVRLSGPSDSSYRRQFLRVMTAAVLAQAGLRDSAARVVASVPRNRDLDPTADLVYAAAFVYTLLGDTTRAVQSLGEYLTLNTQRRNSLRDDPGWWFRPISNHAGFLRLIRQSQ